jgi:hypothetical protein
MDAEIVVFVFVFYFFARLTEILLGRLRFTKGGKNDYK